MYTTAAASARSAAVAVPMTALAVALAVDQHGARAALAGVAAHMGAGEQQVLAQRMDKQGVGRNINADGAPVDGELDLPLAVS